jgi:RNA polymerase sigma factor for flagellar operon FliA
MMHPRDTGAAAVAEALWRRWREEGDTSARSQLLDRYLGLVYHAAREMMKRASRDIEIHDLVSAGTIGLVQALEGFEPSRGLAFSTYAVPRIRGSILDELRSHDRMPRTVRARRRAIAAARSQLQHAHGRSPSASEVADALGVDLATLWKWEQDIDRRAPVALDQSAGTGGGETPLVESIADPTTPEPDARIARDESLGELRGAFDALPQRERLVLTLYYYEELNLRQIGEVMHVSESRISQIRTRALKRLRELVEDCVQDRAA